MSTDFTLQLFSDGQVECSEPSFALRVRTVPREVLKPFSSPSPISAVYLLLDDARQVYYVGETDNANQRHKKHVREYPWWNHAVYFHVPAFGVQSLRRYLQDKLFARVRSLQAGVVLVTSLAGFNGPVPPNGVTFWQQICLCGRVLRLLPFLDDSLFAGTLTVTPMDAPPPPPPPPRWNSPRELARALAQKYGGGVDYLVQLLTAYRGRRAGPAWKPRLEAAGVVFDHSTGLVRDWSNAKNPLP